MKVAVSGNRQGLTDKSRRYLKQYLQNHQVSEIHHGDCVGVDANVHTLSHQINIKVIVHPPASNKMRANCKIKQQDQMRLERPFLKRNKQMVNESDILIAFPATKNQMLRSGTWSTIRYARKSKKTVIIVFQDGSFQQQRA